MVATAPGIICPKAENRGTAGECVRLSPFSREEKSFLNDFPSEFLFRSHWPYWAHGHPLVQGGTGKLGVGEGHGLTYILKRSFWLLG